MRTIVPPEVDMHAVSRNSRIQRRSILGFVPKIGLMCVDYDRIDEVDNFYMDCQNLRDYYRDSHHKLTKPVAFKKHYGRCGGPQDRITGLLLTPTTWVPERQPAHCPLKYDRSLNLSGGIRIGAQYDPTSCNKFKR